ncbi:MAG: DNA repair protein RecN, partial [Brachymonas sp.]|nr:DNA repair protein RecN [Brachymonas sp.]
HYLVSKTADSAQALPSSKVEELAADTRLQEIARMLGGHADSPASISHAKEMVAQAQTPAS